MRLALAVVVALLTPGAVVAQVTVPQTPLGVRFLRGEPLPAPFSLSLVSPTADGFVALTVDDRLAGRLELGREPHSTTEYYLPDDVLQWTAGINSLLAWMIIREDTGATPAFALGATDGVFIDVRGVLEAGRRTAKFRLNRCRESQTESTVDAGTLISIAARFRRAALRARAVGINRPPDEAIWYGHAVGCPATAQRENPPPPWPRGVTELRPRQELMQVVVDATGRVEPRSERFLASSDPRFTAAIRSVLPSWRFTPGRRMAKPVRQVVHLNVGFTPPVAVDPDGRNCTDAAVPHCEVLFSTTALWDVVSILPQGDGMVRIANAAEADGRHLIREREHTAVTIPARQLQQFIDTVATLLPQIDTAGPVANGPDYAPDAPMLGTEHTLGLTMWLSRTGWIRAGFLCGRPGMGQARFVEVRPSEFSAFRRAALTAVQRVPIQRAWTARSGRPYLEHELTCHPVRTGHHPLPALQGHDQTSIETLLQVTVDENGNVDSSGVDILPGLDSLTRSWLVSAMKRWTFQPAVAGGMRVRARTHLNLILRPPEADAVVLAGLTRELTAADTVQRTVFFQPMGQPQHFAPLITPNGLQHALPLFQPFIERARQSWSGVRERFVTGLPLENELVVTVLVEDNMGNSTFAYIRVDRVVDGVIHGRIWRDLSVASEWKRGDPYAMAEVDLLDWMIIRPGGATEGNFLGRFLGSGLRIRFP